MVNKESQFHGPKKENHMQSLAKTKTHEFPFKRLRSTNSLHAPKDQLVHHHKSSKKKWKIKIHASSLHFTSLKNTPSQSDHAPDSYNICKRFQSLVLGILSIFPGHHHSLHSYFIYRHTQTQSFSSWAPFSSFLSFIFLDSSVIWSSNPFYISCPHSQDK